MAREDSAGVRNHSEPLLVHEASDYILEEVDAGVSSESEKLRRRPRSHTEAAADEQISVCSDDSLATAATSTDKKEEMQMERVQRVSSLSFLTALTWVMLGRCYHWRN